MIPRKTIALALLLSLVGCKEEDKSVSLRGSLFGEWFVKTYLGGVDSAGIVLDYQRILTTDTGLTASNELWVDDLGNIWPFKVRAKITGETTFFVDAGENLLWPMFDTLPQTATIRNGRVFHQAGNSASGRIVDSIYMEVEFSDVPGTSYFIAGHGRTGFLEDEL